MLHVVAGAVFDGEGRVLIALRPAHAHQGGKWEFPGGKLDDGEAPLTGLVRELDEETGVRVQSARPLIRIHWPYPGRHVLLDVWRVTAWSGRAHGREGQEIRWADPVSLDAAAFPPANAAIIAALRLPPLYLVTPEPKPPYPDFLERLEALVRAGVRMVQLRAKSMAPADFVTLARRAQAICHAGGARLLVNADAATALACGADGLHLTSARLHEYARRPVPDRMLLAASCHDAAQVDRAAALECDFVVAGPVAPTISHPGMAPIGMDGFGAIALRAGRPVYALGGMQAEDLPAVWRAGGQGIAAISALWLARSPQVAVQACLAVAQWSISADSVSPPRGQ
ncbi:MAG: Nudix family hydrolase [Gammaproteobacteria bacterium]